MRRIVSSIALSSIGIASCFTLVAGAARAGDHDLGALKWKARPVIVLSNSRDDPRVARQISALDATKPGLLERDIEVLQEADTNGKLHKQLGLSETGFAVVLVGKDGEVKKVWRDPVDPKQIFTVIDRMPMRRDEMKG